MNCIEILRGLSSRCLTGYDLENISSEILLFYSPFDEEDGTVFDVATRPSLDILCLPLPNSSPPLGKIFHPQNMLFGPLGGGTGPLYAFFHPSPKKILQIIAANHGSTRTIRKIGVLSFMMFTNHSEMISIY